MSGFYQKTFPGRAETQLLHQVAFFWEPFLVIASIRFSIKSDIKSDIKMIRQGVKKEKNKKLVKAESEHVQRKILLFAFVFLVQTGSLELGSLFKSCLFACPLADITHPGE